MLRLATQTVSRATASAARTSCTTAAGGVIAQASQVVVGSRPPSSGYSPFGTWSSIAAKVRPAFTLANPLKTFRRQLDDQLEALRDQMARNEKDIIDRTDEFKQTKALLKETQQKLDQLEQAVISKKNKLK